MITDYPASESPESEVKRPLLVLIDGHAVAYRAYFALKASGFLTESGEPTNATYGFTRVLLDILEEGPDYFAVSFDRGMSGREAIFPDYKGTREKMEEELVVQLDRIEEVVRAFNIPVLAIDGYEADDIIGTAATQAETQGCRVRIISGDRDILQLVTEHTQVQLPDRKEGGDKLWGLADFAEAYAGLHPIQLTDLKGLMGDSSDNIPGVKGIGEKGALKLILEYGSLENLYEHLWEIKGKQHEYLKNDREMAFLSKELATIKKDIPITLDLQACVTHDFDPSAVLELFRVLQFRTFSKRLRNLHAALNLEEDNPSLAESSTTPKANASLVLPIGTAEPIAYTVHTVTTHEQLAACVAQLEAAEWIGFDVETTGLDQMSARLVGISLAVNGTAGYYIPVGHVAPDSSPDVIGGVNTQGKIDTSTAGIPYQASLFDTPSTDNLAQLPLHTVLAAITPALTNPTIKKMAHNAKYDLIVLRRYGLDVRPVLMDTMLAEWVRDPASKNLGLKNLVGYVLRHPMQEITELIGSGAKQTSFARVPINQAAEYAVPDTVMLHHLRPRFDVLWADYKMRHLFQEIEMPLIPVIADMEMHGVLIDTDYLQVLSEELDIRLYDVQREIYDLSGGYGEFNINSLDQLSDVLFTKLGLSSEGLRKTRKLGRISLDATTLEELRGRHPIIDHVLEYRQLAKLKSTYVDALPKLVNSQTGRVHTSYNQTGAVTGRFSSQDPNLQNIPIRAEEGRRIRKAFIAAPGYQLLAVDYSQVELRILAHFSEDEALLSAFRQGLDIHRRTASEVYRVPMEEVTFEQRSFAKAVNFGLMYGMSAFRLARDFDMLQSEARNFVDEYFARFPGVKAYLDSSKEFARQHGYVETLLGRRRNFPILAGDKIRGESQARQRAEREAINMPIQGTAADILKIAMLKLHAALQQEGYRAAMMLQVHDELVLEVAEDDLSEVVPLVKNIMENAYPLKTPLKADAKIGPNWYDMKAWE